jgi:ATP-binding cassette subfamily C protein
VSATEAEAHVESATVIDDAVPSAAAPGEVRRLMRWVWRTVPRPFVVTLALVLAGGVAEALSMVLLVPLLRAAGLPVDGGAAGRAGEAAVSVLAVVGVPPTLAAVLALYVAVVGAQALVQRAQTVASFALDKEVAHLLRTRLYGAAAHARWPFLVRRRSSDFVHAMTGEADRAEAAVSWVVALVTQAVMGGAHLAVALAVSPAVTGAALLCGAALLLALRGPRRRTHESAERISDATQAVFAAASEHLAGMKVVKSHGAEGRSAARFAALSAASRDVYLQAVRASADARAGFSVGAAALFALVVWLGIEVVELAPAVALLLLFVFSRLVPRLATFQQGWQHLLQDLPGFRRVQALIAACEAEREADDAPGAPAVPLERAVRLEGVTFAYPEHEPVVARLSLAIEARRTTALVGPSGCGKTTVADLVMGLLRPREGAVTVDGVPLEPAGMHAWRGEIGYVAQDTVLFHDSVRANLAWAAPGAGEAEIRAALAAAAADGFVDALPRGLDTVVGDRGVRLSGGERQRLALARSLLRRPALLILDEATSALDPENERRILEAVADLHGRTTILLITHRLATVRGADAVYVMDAGRVVQHGTPDALASVPGRFREMWAAQDAPRGDAARGEE